MEKFTREYVEKLAINKYGEPLNDNSIRRLEGFSDGYMKAIEETNVSELLEALVKLSQLVKNAGHDLWLEHSGSINAINKAEL